MDVLRELAMQGKTIITSIHQPSSQIFQSFDQLILLADGKTIFMVNTYSFYPNIFTSLFFVG
jgi:ABC-type multidrug transport system ATPase subunit